MSQMGVHHLDAAGAVRSMLRNNEELLTVLSTAVVTAVLELSSNYGRRARWCALLRSVLSTRGRPIAKNQRKMLAILTENRALMLDLEGRHRGSPVDPVPSDANGDQTRKTSDAFRLMSEATQRKQARLERLQLICEREQLHPYNSTLA